MPDTTNQPLYQKIKQDIFRQIESNLLLPGDRLPTEHQLMEQYDVSRITISKALNELKKEGILDSYPGRGTFVAKAASIPSLVKESTSQKPLPAAPGAMTEIACVIPHFEDLFSLSMIKGIQSVFPDDSYICHIFQSKNPRIENYLLQRCMEINISGIVLFPQDQPFFSNELLSLLLHNYPLVLIDRYLLHLDTSYVIADNAAAGALCLEHLHGLGHQRIAFVTTSVQDTFSIKHRIEGIREAAKRLDMPPQSIHIVENLDCRKKLVYYQELFQRLIVEERVTAFIASESGGCTYLDELFASMNFKVPDKISLMSFDKPVSSSRIPDFFTHINQSEYLMGREAGNLLLRRLEERDMNIYHRVIAPRLVVCKSTGPVVL